MDSDPNAKIAWSQEQLNLFWLKISLQAWNLEVHKHVIMVQYWQYTMSGTQSLKAKFYSSWEKNNDKL